MILADKCYTILRMKHYFKTLAAPCENVSSGICGQRGPRSDCASAQSDQDLHCLLTELIDTTECINSKYPDDTLRMRRMNLNLCICACSETFLLSAICFKI